jgi:hypothetical protein
VCRHRLAILLRRRRAVLRSTEPLRSKPARSGGRLASRALCGARGGNPRGSGWQPAYIRGVRLARIGATAMCLAVRRCFQPFEFHGAEAATAARRSTVTQAPVRRPKATAFRTAFQALSFSDDAASSGEIVFAGYGIVVAGRRRTSATTACRPRRQGQGGAGPAVLSRRMPTPRRSRSWRVTPIFATRRWRRGSAGEGDAGRDRTAVSERRRVVPMTFDTAHRRLRHPAASIAAVSANAMIAGRKTSRRCRRSVDGGNPHVAVSPSTRCHCRARHQGAAGEAATGATSSPTCGERSAIWPPEAWIAIGAHTIISDAAPTGLAGHREEAGRAHPGADTNAQARGGPAIADDAVEAPRRRNC